MSKETMDNWVLGSSLAFIIIAVLNPFIVIGKEKSSGFKDFFVNFGGIFGIEHHLYGHIWVFIFLFVIFTLLFAYTTLGATIAEALKIDDYEKMGYWVVGSIIFFFVIVSLFYLMEVLE